MNIFCDVISKMNPRGILLATVLLTSCSSDEDVGVGVFEPGMELNTDEELVSNAQELLPESLLSSSTVAVTNSGLEVVQLPDGRQFYQGDILVPETPPTAECVPESSDTSTGNGFSTNTSCLNFVSGISGDRWTGSVMPIRLDPGLTPDLVERILDAKSLIERESGLLLPTYIRGVHEDYVDIVLSSDRNYSNSIGRKGGRQEIGLTDDDDLTDMEVVRIAPFGTVLHELLHAAGAFHEHARMDAEGSILSAGFIRIERLNMQNTREARAQFTVDSGSFPRGDYDYNSVMHYSSTGYGLCGGGLVPDDDGCEAGSDMLFCPDGSMPPTSSGRCTTIYPTAVVPSVNITCPAGKYSCSMTGQRMSGVMGQRIGLSPTDIAQLRQEYKDTTISIELNFEKNGFSGGPTLFLDGEVLIDQLGSGGTNFTIGAIQQDVGRHQIALSESEDRDLHRYVVIIGGDCDADGNYDIARKERKICTLDIESVDKNTATLVSPIGDVVDPNPDFIWSQVPGTFQAYEFRLTTQNGTVLFEQSYGQEVIFEICNISPGVCILNDAEIPLEAGQNYRWQIRSDDGADSGSSVFRPWSLHSEFSYLP